MTATALAARCVAAIQNGKPIFYMTASSVAPNRGYEHQKTMPAAPSPDDPNRRPISPALAHLCCHRRSKRAFCDKPLEIRGPVEFHNPMKGHTAEPNAVWIRANGTAPEDFRVHQYLLGYASDLTSCRLHCSRTEWGSLKKGCRLRRSITRCGSIVHLT